jgi:hypothetical protein
MITMVMVKVVVVVVVSWLTSGGPSWIFLSCIVSLGLCLGLCALSIFLVYPVLHSYGHALIAFGWVLVLFMHDLPIGQ